MQVWIFFVVNETHFKITINPCNYFLIVYDMISLLTSTNFEWSLNKYNPI